MDQNRFGGIAGSNYTPMSEDEQEVLSRLVATRDMDVFIKGWGHIKGVEGAIAGDLRLAIPIVIRPTGPAGRKGTATVHIHTNCRTQSQIKRSSAQSPPPITFPALALAKAIPEGFKND